MLIHTNVVRKIKRDLSGDEANEDTAHKRKKHEYASNAFEDGKLIWAALFCCGYCSRCAGQQLCSWSNSSTYALTVYLTPFVDFLSR